MSESASTITKALDLLDLFSERSPRIGLSEIAKISGYNKASTLRFLNALQAGGFVEQDEATKTYCIGPAFLRFAQLREAVVPMAEAIRHVLRDLNIATRETAHVALLAGDSLANIGTVESKRANRVSIEPGEKLPFHATSSGQVVLAHLEPAALSALLDRELRVHAPQTLTDPGRIRALLPEIRKNGFAMSSGSYEDGVTGIAAPYFGPDGRVCGSVAVAIPTSRATDELCANVVGHVCAAARRLTELRGGPHGGPATGKEEKSGERQ